MPAPLRVLAVGSLYPPHQLGGYEIIWRGVTRELSRAGHRARVLTTTYRRPDVAGDDDPDVYRELEWYWHEHEWRRLRPRARLALERHNAAVFDRHLNEFRPDVIAWWPLGGMSLTLVERARRAGIPAVFFVLDPWPAYGPRHDLWLRMWRWTGPGRALVERSTGLPARVELAEAGHWVFCSEWMREQTLEVVPVLPVSNVIHPGVSEAFLAAGPDPQPESWRWQLLYVGRVVEQKGVRTAIEALPLLPQPATLRIVGEGDGDYRGELEQLTHRLGVAERVRLEPPRPHQRLLEVYRAADAVVFPVLWGEPFGLVPLEAMALGRPVVATGRGGSGEYLEPERNALTFGPGDPQALAAAVRRLAGDPELRDRLRTAGRQTATRFSEGAFNRAAVAEIEAAAGASSAPELR